LKVYANGTSGKVGASNTAYFSVDLPPTGSITINNGSAYSSSTGVMLTLTYSDPGSGVSQVRYCNDGVSWSSWEVPSPTKAWILSSGEGLKTVSYQIKDNGGHLSSTLDTSTPRGNIQINSGAAYANSAMVTLNLLAQDDISGVTQMRFANDWGTWTSWEAYSTSKSWTLTAGDGEKTVLVQYIDRVNLTVTAYDIIILDMTRPTARAGQNQAVEIYTPATFNGSASTDNTGIANYLWDFGDGATGNGVAPTHEYTSVGNYLVTLMVEDLAGNKASSTSSVTIVVFIPEFQPSLILLMLIMMTLAAAMQLRYRKHT
jgi:PKD repeat protein